MKLTCFLSIKYVGKWTPINVKDEAERYRYDFDANKKDIFLCKYGNYGEPNNSIKSDPLKKWLCGVPRIGLQSDKGGLDSNAPENGKGYRPGTCSVHVKQFQKPDPSKDDYALEISSVTDANQKKIGGRGKGGKDVVLKTKLPETISFWTGGVDKDPIRFQYGKDKWTSNDEKRCKVGKYDSGDREMDCTFTCD